MYIILYYAEIILMNYTVIDQKLFNCNGVTTIILKCYVI